MQHLQIPLFCPRSIIKSFTIIAFFFSLSLPVSAGAAGILDSLFGPTPEQIRAESDAYVHKVRADTEREIRLEKLDALTAPVRAAEAEYEARKEAERRAEQYRGDSRYYQAQYDKLSDALAEHKSLLNQYVSDLNIFRLLAFALGALAIWAAGMWLFERRDRRRERAEFESILIQANIRPEHVIEGRYLDHRTAYPVSKAVRYDR